MEARWPPPPAGSEAGASSPESAAGLPPSSRSRRRWSSAVGWRSSRWPPTPARTAEVRRPARPPARPRAPRPCRRTGPRIRSSPPVAPPTRARAARPRRPETATRRATGTARATRTRVTATEVAGAAATAAGASPPDVRAGGSRRSSERTARNLSPPASTDEARDISASRRTVTGITVTRMTTKTIAFTTGRSCPRWMWSRM